MGLWESKELAKQEENGIVENGNCGRLEGLWETQGLVGQCRELWETNRLLDNIGNYRWDYGKTWKL